MGLQAPCGESGSVCGFSAGFAGLQIDDSRRRSRRNVGIRAGMAEECGKGGKPDFGLFTLPILRHFHGLVVPKRRLAAFCEQVIKPAILRNSKAQISTTPDQCLQLANRTNRIGLHGSTSRQIARQHRHRSQQQHNPKYRHRIIGADPV